MVARWDPSSKSFLISHSLISSSLKFLAFAEELLKSTSRCLNIQFMLDGADCLQITFLLLEFSSCFDQQHRVIRYIYYSTDMSWQRTFHASGLVEGKQARQEL